MLFTRCKKCVMPNTRPGLVFDDDGICMACHNHEKQQHVDWNDRFKELEILCDMYRRGDGYYDCIIPVSGGKDSHMQVYVMKELLHMNPLLICVADPFTHTKAGIHNIRNISETFNCDMITYQMSIDLFRRVTRIGFEILHETLRFIESAIYTVPFKYAVDLNIPLVIWGENNAYLYGASDIDTLDARKYVEAGHSASGDSLGGGLTDYWVEHGIELSDLNSVIMPSPHIAKSVIPMFLSYFIKWDDERNYAIAKRYGFKDLHHEWDREGCVEDYMQIDSLAYLIHIWTKYPKFGFSRTTDIASRWVRKGMITRDVAMDLVRKYDHKLDQRAVDDFCDFMKYTHREFWNIIETYWNEDLFEKVDGVWKPKVKE